jgi:type I restriction enzyme, S subunit
MIHDLKPYPAYKDSGLPWLGQVPKHWEMERAKLMFRKMDRPVRDIDEVVTCFRDGVVTLRRNRRVRGFTESLKEIGYQGIRRGDLVIHAMDAFAGAVGVADSDGKGTPVYSVCEPATGTNSHYYAYTVREMARSQWILALAKGIRERSTDFRFDGFASQLVPLPPLPEQSAIVRFLDHVDRRIRRYIGAKQKLIKLLEEQKQVIIHRAVTRGLDPNVRLKPSGIEWLGEVPEHWRVLPIKRAFVSMDYGISESAIDAGTIRLLTMGNINDGRVTIPETGGVAAVDASFLLEVGDLLFNRTNSSELVGKVGLYTGADLPVTFASYLVRLRPRREHDPEYLNAILNDVSVLSIARREAIPSLHQSNLNPTRYGRLQVSLPPLEEQRGILQYLKSETSDLDRAIAAAHQEISLLREYRTRLIADVVTGKLDVREAAPNLPDEPHEMESLEQAEALTENGEESDVDDVTINAGEVEA